MDYSIFTDNLRVINEIIERINFQLWLKKDVIGNRKQQILGL